MEAYAFRRFFLTFTAFVGVAFLTSCTVDQESALFSSGSAAGDKKKERTTKVKTDNETWAEKMKAAREEREEKKAEEEKKRIEELAAKKKEKDAAARKAAYEKRKKDAADKALAEKEAKEKARAEAEKKALAEEKAREKAAKKAQEEKRLAAEKKEREEKLAAQKKERDARRAAKLAAREHSEQEASRRGSSEYVAAVANRRSRGGLFSSFALSTPSKYRSRDHHIEVNNRLLYSLNASNAKIEIDLGDQRARIYKTSGGQKQLVIETQISSGKAGHSTPTGSFRIQEKLQHKRSTLYGRWLNSSGSLVQSSGDSRKRPPGGATFVGTEMPYWMRVTGGIGMHIGYVPNGPASHGCIRVPSVIQPLIYSKVGVGTPVTIAY
jgi:lipoprotein-anchoring transpeptidase ErfK/SrfK